MALKEVEFDVSRALVAKVGVISVGRFATVKADLLFRSTLMVSWYTGIINSVAHTSPVATTGLVVSDKPLSKG